MMGRIKMILMSMLWVTAHCFGQSVLTMDQVLEAAMSSSYDSKGALLNLGIAEGNYSYFKTTLKPQIGMSMSLPDYINTSRGVTQPNGSLVFQSISQNNAAFSIYGSQAIPLTGGSIFFQTDLQRFDDFTSKYKSFNGIPIRVGIVQPLFGFNSIKWAQKINELKWITASKKLNFDMENARRSAAALYIEALLASSNLEIANANEKINENLVRIADERLLLGKLSMDEKLQLQNALASARVNKLQFANQFRNRLMDIDTYVGSDYSNNFDLYLSIPEPLTKMLVDEDLAVKYAVANNYNLDFFAQQLVAADSEIKRTSVENGVQLNLRASFGLARGSSILSDIYRDPYAEQQVNIGLDIPIVNWGRKKEAVKVATLQKELITNQIEQSKVSIINNVRQAVQAFNVLQDEVIIQKTIMENAEKRFEISNQRYILGNIALTDLTIAQSDKDKAKRDYIMAVARYWDAFYGIRTLTAYDFVLNQKI